MNRRALSLSFEAAFGNIDLAREALAGVCTALFGGEEEKASDIVMAATEAMNNAVEHTGSAVVTVELVCDGGELGVFVISGGPPFDPVAASAGLTEEDIMEREEGGYGLYLIRELVDRFEYEYRDASNVWKLFKKIGS